jgi:hypothetical protein
MADPAAIMPQEEKTLRALLRTLGVCLISTRERAEKIASLGFDSYCRMYADLRSDDVIDVTPEDKDNADMAFNEDVDHAEEVLEWRAIVMADLAGRVMLGYAGARSPLDDPWMTWWRESPDGPAAEFVHAFNEEEFFCARVAYHVHADFGIRRPRAVPTDGDLEDIPGYLETEQAKTWEEWLEVLGPRQGETPLSLATAAAKRDLAEGHARPGSEIGARIAELRDQVAAFQMPTIERLESIGTQIDSLGAPNRFKAEEFLVEALGVEVYSSLSDDARTAALDAERRFRDRETLDWNSVVGEMAKAFEIQVKQRFVPCLARYLKQKGLAEFPKDEYFPIRNPNEPPTEKRAIIKRGEAVSGLMLGMISIALTSSRPELQEFGQSSGIDLPELKKHIDNLNPDRNRGTHETGMSFAEAWRLRADWLGVSAGDGGIFGALLPKRGCVDGSARIDARL